MSEGLLTGVVKFFKTENAGYGFIFPTKDGKFVMRGEGDQSQREEIFFHAAKISEDPETKRKYDLAREDEVTFELSHSSRHPNEVEAINVTLVKRARSRHQTSLPVANVTIGVRKTDLPVLVSLLKDYLKPETAKQLNEGEIKAISEHVRVLENAEKRLVMDAKPASGPVVENGSRAKSKKEKTSSTAAAPQS